MTSSVKHPFVDETLDELIFKRSGFLHARHAISTVALGSSIGDCSFNPEFFPGSYNLCTASQDLQYGSLLYDYAAAQAPNLKHVVFFYGLFSPGFELAKCDEKCRCAAYKEIFGFGYTPHPKIDAAYHSIENRYRDKSVVSDTLGFIKSDDKTYIGGEVGERVKKHLAFAMIDDATRRKYESQMHHLAWMIKSAGMQGHSFTVVIPPVRSDYRSAAPDKATIFKSLYEFYRLREDYGDFDLIDFYDDPRFTDGEFNSFFHLASASSGAERLSKDIHRRVTQS